MAAEWWLENGKLVTLGPSQRGKIIEKLTITRPVYFVVWAPLSEVTPREAATIGKLSSTGSLLFMDGVYVLQVKGGSLPVAQQVLLQLKQQLERMGRDDANSVSICI